MRNLVALNDLEIDGREGKGYQSLDPAPAILRNSYFVVGHFRNVYNENLKNKH